MKAQLALCMKYMPAACMKSLTLTHEGLEFGFAKFQFIEQRWGASSKMLLMFLQLTKSHGHRVQHEGQHADCTCAGGVGGIE